MFIAAACAAIAQTPNGERLFKEQCAACHNGEPNNRAPAPDVLKQRTPQAIMDSFLGVMRVQGAKLSGPERRAVAAYITGKELGGDPTGAAFGRCPATPAFSITASNPMWNGWGADVANTHAVSAKQAGMTAADLGKLKLKWAFGFPDATMAWAQPAVAGGRVFVGSHNGSVYSLDAKSGCIYWVFSAQGGVRTGMTIAPREGAPGYAVYFGDTNANAYALDASTGKQLWIQKLDDHPLARVTGTPVLYQARLYVPLASYEESQGANPEYECCTFRGSLSAIDVKNGKVLWKSYTIDTVPKPRGKSSKDKTLWGPSGSAIWSAPTVDAKRGLVYAATGNTYSEPEQPSSDAVIAFEMETGKIRWTRTITPKDVFLSGCRGTGNANCPEQNGPDFDFGNPPILTKLPDGRDAIVIGQKSGVGFALDIEKKGEVIWQYKAGEGGALGGIEWGSAVDAENAYFPLSDISRPKPGGLHAVKLATGERVWYAPPPPLKCAAGRGCNAAQSAAITVIPGAVISGSVDGGLRAYSTKDGSIVWEFDTNRDFETVNKVPAKGASMIGPGPVVAGGMLFVNSGYGAFGGRPGNVLLAFSID
jgi:polyvinyl alcohol dehydrogenase (cytochrome)